MSKKIIPKEFRKKVVSCYLSPFEIESIDKISKETDRSRLYVIEQAIIEYIKKYSEEENKLK